ncbi:MAG: hypothetical protein GWP08_15355 [Nitrospiraceae bacterium]|nr:hypothetical protein [Nitrospiraceae bacterium]
MDSIFRSIKTYPDRKDANGVVMRLLDGLGYRFYWATEGLSDVDVSFSPRKHSQSIGELMTHIWGLAHWVHLNLLGKRLTDARPDNPAEARVQALDTLAAIREYVARVDEQELFACEVEGMPFWHVINGPLADVLTHTGQIASLRRLNGNPVLKHNVFLCHDREKNKA